MNDDELLRRCRDGDEEAWVELTLRFQDSLYRLAFRTLGDGALAEDAAADAFAVVWERCRSWRGEASAGAWIRQVAWRVVLDAHRSRSRRWRFWRLEGAAVPTNDADPATSAILTEESVERNRRVAAALERLSVDERALVHWHYYEGMPLAEIAEILGVTRDALKMRLSRIRTRLRPLLGDGFELD